MSALKNLEYQLRDVSLGLYIIYDLASGAHCGKSKCSTCGDIRQTVHGVVCRGGLSRGCCGAASGLRHPMAKRIREHLIHLNDLGRIKPSTELYIAALDPDFEEGDLDLKGQKLRRAEDIMLRTVIESADGEFFENCDGDWESATGINPTWSRYCHACESSEWTAFCIPNAIDYSVRDVQYGVKKTQN